MAVINWDNAALQCNKILPNAYLVAINDKSEALFIEATILPRYPSVKPGSKDGVWIGLNDKTINDVYLWPPYNTPLGSYTNWDASEPSNTYKNEDCVKLWKLNGLPKWNDARCTDNARIAGFICEYDPTGKFMTVLLAVR